MDKPIPMDRIKSERIEFRWRERLPKGMIAVVAGPADQGKGLFAAHVAAEVSKTERVLYSAWEDSYGSMSKPRLRAAGANLKNVLAWRFKLPRQWPELANLIVKHDIGMVVMDPLASHLTGGVSRHSDNIRTVTDPLAELIEKTGTSVLIVEHIVKGRRSMDTDPLTLIGGSGSGLTAAARAGFLLGTDPQDPDRRIVGCVKLNVRDRPQALAFEMDVVDDRQCGEVPLLRYQEEVPGFDVMRMFTKKKGTIGRPPDKKAAAAEWLSNYLALAGGPVLASQIFEDAKHYAMTAKTLRRAAEDMHIVKSAGGGPKVTWDLPEHVKKLMGLTEPDEELPAPDPDGDPDGDVDGEAPPSADEWDDALKELLDRKDDEEGDGDE